MTVPTLEELARINPDRDEDPPGWTVAEGQREVEAFRAAVESVLGPVHWIGNAGATISQAGGGIPSDAKIVQANAFMGINLSKFGRLFTITYDWDMKPETLRQLLEATSEGGFRYAPFTLFADPRNYRWEYADAFMRTRVAPPNFRLEHEDVFESLFGCP
jgi:hypothetical protein